MYTRCYSGAMLKGVYIAQLNAIKGRPSGLLVVSMLSVQQTECAEQYVHNLS